VTTQQSSVGDKFVLEEVFLCFRRFLLKIICDEYPYC